MKRVNVRFRFMQQLVGLSAVLLPVIVACADSAPYVDTDSEPEVTESVDTEDAATADSATANENAIALYGEFSEHLGGTLFVMEATGGVEAGEVLVVNDSQFGFEVPGDAGTPLWAIGEVRPLDISAIDGVDPAALEIYAGEPAVYAQRITLVPEPSELNANPEAFYGEALTVYGEVEQIDTDNAFILEDPELFEGQGIVVIPTADATTEIIPDDAKITASGVLRPAGIADLEDDYGLSADRDLLDVLETDYVDSPILIADLIVPTNND